MNKKEWTESIIIDNSIITHIGLDKEHGKVSS